MSSLWRRDRSSASHEVGGVKIPIFRCEKCDERFAREEDIREKVESVREKVRKALKEKGIDVVEE
ncbi:MAG: hypothetical protein SVV03_06400 [Candidatus Nanohaloarchaea archaeon]|nr:hypothetical protein [Candidatus Nanohaloarchaea archaeon]